MKDSRLLELCTLLLVVWLTFLTILLFLDVIVVPFEFPIIGYIGRVITGIVKVVIGVGLFITWLYLWNTMVKWYFRRALKPS